MRLIKNEVVVNDNFFVLLPVKLPLMLMPLRACHAVLDSMFWGGFKVIAGSHHLAVMRDEIRVICVRDIDYC